MGPSQECTVVGAEVSVPRRGALGALCRGGWLKQ